MIHRQPTKEFFTKFAALAEDCHYIRKDAKNEFHRYKYVSAANVLEKISEALTKHGLVSWTRARIYDIRERTTAKGSTEYLAFVRVELFVVLIETGEGITIVAYGAGQDQGDKAVMKAETAGLKYAWMMGLNIATGDDPEADTKTDKRNAKRAAPALITGPEVVEETEDEKRWKAAAKWAVQNLMRCKNCECPMVPFRAGDGKIYLICEDMVKSMRQAKTEAERDVIREVARKHDRIEWQVEGAGPARQAAE